MNPEQARAAAALYLALKKCRAAGLSGGVYSSNFCVWPTGGDPHAGHADFFANVDTLGGMVLSGSHCMHLDSGAGN